MKRITKWLLWVLFFVGVIMTFVFLWSKGQAKQVNYIEVSPLVGDSIQNQITLSGSIKPRDEVSIKPQISGIISEILVEPGQDVQVGDIIAKISVIPDMQQVNSAESRVEQERIALDRVKRIHSRDKALYDKGLIATEEYEKSRAELDQARVQYSTAEQALQITKSGVSSKYSKQSSTLVRATITGKILSIPVKVGSSVIQANTLNEGTTIATIADMKNLIFEGNADETEVGKLAIGQTMNLSIGAITGLKLSATLESIAPQGTSTNGTMLFPIKGRLTSSDETLLAQLRAGFSATADVVIVKAKGIMTIPESCLSYRGDSTFVQIIGSDGQVKERYIKTGISDGAKIEVLQGLKKEDKIQGNAIADDAK